MNTGRYRMTFGQLVAVAAISIPVLAVLSLPFSVIDLAYLVRAGDVMLDTSALLRTDTFTFTATGHEWLNQQWGTEIVVALVHRAGGMVGLIMVRGALVGVIFLLEYLSCRAAGAARRGAGWLTLMAFVVCYFGLALRANLVGLTFFVLTLWILEGREHRPRLLWLIPAIVIVWTNTHGSFPLVFPLLLIAWLEDRPAHAPRARTIALVALACFASTFVNPFGARVWEYVAELTTNPRIGEFITEWQPTWGTWIVAIPFLLSAALVAAIVARRRSEIAWPRLLGLGLFFVLGLQAVRGVLWWAIAAPVLIAPLVRERAPREDPATRPNLLFASALLLMMVAFPLLRPSNDDGSGSTAMGGRLSHAPERFTDAVASVAAPGSRIFVAQIWASWFEMTLPNDPVFIDPRIEVFPAEVWRDYDLVSEAGEGWEDLLDSWDVDVLVLSYEQQRPLIEEIAGDQGWRPIYRSPAGVALIRVGQTS